MTRSRTMSRLGATMTPSKALPGVKLSREVARVLNARVEHKRALSTGTSNIDWSTSGVINQISTDIAQGDNIGQRSGDVIRPQRLVVRVFLTGSNSTFVGRVVLFQDTMANGATPAVTDLLDSATYISSYAATTRQERRFKVLADRYISSCASSNNNAVVEVFDLRMKGSIHYLGSASGAASAGRNTLFILFISNASSAGAIVYKWSYDLEYTDS